MKIERAKHCLDVHEADLSGSKFDDVNLSGARFENVNLSGGDYHNVNLSGCVFDDINMSGWRVHNVNLSGLRIDKANLAGASIVNSRMDGMTIEGIPVTALLAFWKIGHGDNGQQEDKKVSESSLDEKLPDKCDQIMNQLEALGPKERRKEFEAAERYLRSKKGREEFSLPPPEKHARAKLKTVSKVKQ
jgi:Pentapeptide repeats (9 copies)